MSVKQNLIDIQDRITACIDKWSREQGSITLVAVSKMQPPDRIHEALLAGQRTFGENRVQEAKERWLPIKSKYTDLTLHLIGPLQTNKVKDAVALFDVIHTLDRENLALELSKEMQKQGRLLPCLIQVNTGAEPQKSGITPDSLPEFLTFCRAQGLNITGLMCIPPLNDPPALHFGLLNKLAREQGLQQLSMGMSDDFEKAIPLGATYVRIGSAIFGDRATTA